MKLTQVKILARMYDIIWIEDEHAEDANLRAQHKQSWGEHKIKIAKKSKNAMLDLLHEIEHSLVFQLHLDDRDWKLRDYCVPAVDMLSEQLLGVIRENKINLLDDLEP